MCPGLGPCWADGTTMAMWVAFVVAAGCACLVATAGGITALNVDEDERGAVAVPTVSISALCCLICIGLSIAWGVTMQEEWEALGQPLPPPEPPAPPSPSPPVINPPPQPRGPPPPLPPAPLTKTLLHRDKICEDGSMATGDLDLDTCAHNAFAAGATCIAHVPNGCWICDSCTPIIDYPDGDLYELSADYSPPTPLSPQPPAPAFYEEGHQPVQPVVGDAITIVADAGSATSAPAARRLRPGDDLRRARAGVAGRKGRFAVWLSQSKCYICDSREAEGVPGNTLYEWKRAYSPPSPPPPNPSAPPVAPEASPPPELCGSDSIAGQQKRFDFGGLMVDSGEEKGKRLGCEGNATSYVCQSVALSVVPGHPLCIINPDCIDVSEFKALAQDLFVTNLMDLLLELANAIAIFAAYYFASSSLLLLTLAFDMYLTGEAIMVAYQIQPLARPSSTPTASTSSRTTARRAARPTR